MSCKYNNCKHCGYKSECEIFKENAELNETLGKCAKMPVLYCLGAKETITKAKEIIRAFMTFDSSYKNDDEYQEVAKQYDLLIADAEAFLKE